MSERMIPVPESLARSIVNQLRADAEQIDGEWGHCRTADGIRASDDPDDYGKRQVAMSDQIDALLSQPTPTAEPSALGLREHIGPDGSNYIMPAEPPRIEDMAPGTTFICEGKGVPGVEHHMRVTRHTRIDETRILWCLTHKFGADESYVNSSTIRDVTPPKGEH
jgi:hypothetical protein